MPYPHTRAVDQVDDFFATSVVDPHRWLENTTDPEVTAERVGRLGSKWA